MVNAQEWLDKEYPKNRRNEITELDISKGKVKKWLIHDSTLKGSLNLTDFTNLRTLNCSGHELTNLDVSGCQYLTELDCQSNKLNNLKVNDCSSLRTVNCSNNYFRELDLVTCPELEEVDIKNCLELADSKINSNLTRDTLSGKLMKSGSQIIPAGENDIRNILVIGITGNGKSTLANVLADTDQFIESSSSTSATKSFQESNIFEWEGKKYKIIDNIGFGDTAKIAEEDILFKIGEGIHAAKEGINQVLFVFKGRFAPEQVAVFNMFKDFIAESKITQFTTLVRTNFINFRNQDKCREDKDELLNQSQELKEIIESCNGVIYVDNPVVPKNKQRAGLSLKKRKDSKETVLNHLANNCQEIYKLKEWDSVYAMVNAYHKRKAEIENSNSLTKDEEIRAIKNEVAQGVRKELEASIGVNVPGLPVGINAAFRYKVN